MSTPRKRKLCRGCGKVGVRKTAAYHDECRPRRRPMIVVACLDCGKERRAWSAAVPVRCKPCALQRRGGALNARWLGGISGPNRAFRRSAEYAAWRTSVFERDDYTCVECGQRGGTLHADHIQPFATHPELRLVLDNGRTLCFACHAKTPTFLGGTLRLLNRQRQREKAMPMFDDSVLAAEPARARLVSDEAIAAVARCREGASQ